MELYELIRYLHIAAGAVALATYWTAALLQKGSPRHRAAGRTYLLAMVAITFTAVPLAAAAFAAGKPVTGTFLAYLVVITVSACWLAWRAIRDKGSFQQYAGPVYRTLAWINIVSGAAVLGLALRYQVLLLGVFSLVGLLLGPAMLRHARRGTEDRRWWLREHYGAIIGCGVATHVAFLNLGLQRLVPVGYDQLVQNIAFIGPLAFALLARFWLRQKYGEKRALPFVVPKKR